MERGDVARWLADYVEAWRTYDPDRIAALFAADVEYRYHPYDEPIRGRDAVVESWLGEGDHPDASARDPEGTYDASYAPVAVDGDLAVATGSSTYFESPGGPVKQVFDNCFVMRFADDGRCREFTEWFIERPDT
jgi:ketosteroid isomerase-like protein